MALGPQAPGCCHEDQPAFYRKLEQSMDISAQNTASSSPILAGMTPFSISPRMTCLSAAPAASAKLFWRNWLAMKISGSAPQTRGSSTAIMTISFRLSRNLRISTVQKQLILRIQASWLTLGRWRPCLCPVMQLSMMKLFMRALMREHS